MSKFVKLGSDPMDIYSNPMKIIKTKLSQLFQMQVREAPEKPGRMLGVTWDSRIPLVKGFTNEYSYIVNFKLIGNAAGNHYHLKKQELLYPLIGSFKVILEDINTKEKEEFELNADLHQALYFPTKIAHVIIAQTNPAIFLITANYPASEEDEFPYELA